MARVGTSTRSAGIMLFWNLLREVDWKIFTNSVQNTFNAILIKRLHIVYNAYLAFHSILKSVSEDIN